MGEGGGKGGEMGRERSIASCTVLRPHQNQTHNLGICPDQEWNLQPFGVWDEAATELPSQGMVVF